MPKRQHGRTRSKAVKLNGRTTTSKGGAVIVATDGAADQARVGAGYIATSGHFGMHGHAYGSEISGKDRAVVAELRAVWDALTAITASVQIPVEVRCDSMHALRYLNSWATGGTEMPATYQAAWRLSGRTPTLRRLQELIGGASRLTFVHEKGHAGNPLNETADSLAKLALRCSRGLVAKDVAVDLAGQWARRALMELKP